jgi:hypothetical protein
MNSDLSVEPVASPNTDCSEGRTGIKDRTDKLGYNQSITVHRVTYENKRF